MGAQPTTGYTVSIASATEEAGAITAAITETSPGSNCVVAEVITNPFVAVSVPSHVANEKVAFQVTKTTTNCSQ